MDKKSTVAIVILFTMIVIGSIVYTIFSVVRTDGLRVDRRANVIKEEMVSMEQSIDDGNTTNDDNNKNDNSTVDVNHIPNNMNSDDNKVNQNTPADNTEDNSTGGNNPSVENPNNGNAAEEAKPIVIRDSIFQLNSGDGSYRDIMHISQVGYDVYVSIDEEQAEEGVTYDFPLIAFAPDSYPDEIIKFHAVLLGETSNLPFPDYDGRLSNDNPFLLLPPIRYTKGVTYEIELGWLDGGVRTYTIHID